MSHFSHSIKKKKKTALFLFWSVVFSPVFVWDSKAKKSFYYATLQFTTKEHKTDYQYSKFTFYFKHAIPPPKPNFFFF